MYIWRFLHFPFLLLVCAIYRDMMLMFNMVENGYNSSSSKAINVFYVYSILNRDTTAHDRNNTNTNTKQWSNISIQLCSHKYLHVFLTFGFDIDGVYVLVAFCLYCSCTFLDDLPRSCSSKELLSLVAVFAISVIFNLLGSMFTPLVYAWACYSISSYGFKHPRLQKWSLAFYGFGYIHSTVC